MYELCANCLNFGKLKDKSTPPIKNVIKGIIIKITKDIKNTGYCIPSCSCFFLANLAKKNIKIKAIIIAPKKISKFVHTGAGV